MKKINQLVKLFLAAFFLLGISHHSEAQLLKRLKKAAEEKIAPKSNESSTSENSNANSSTVILSNDSKGKSGKVHDKDYEDPKGVSGTYYALNGNELFEGVSQTTLKFNFIEKENGTFVNELRIYYDGDNAKYFYLMEAATKKVGGKAFQISNGYKNDVFVEITDGVYARIVASVYPDNLYGGEQVIDVLAKNKDDFETFDVETAQAKYDDMIRKSMKVEVDKKREDLMTYKAYKENIGKVVFVPSYGVFNYRYKDKPKEDPSKFIKSTSMGAALYYGAYLNEPMDVSCGKDCEFTAVYEMNGITADRVELRNSEAKWQRMVKERKAESRMCINNGYGLWSPSENSLDYAYAKVLYENKDKFVKGKTYKLNVTLHTTRDGNHVEKVAEGSINLVYDAAAEKSLNEKIFRDYKKFLDE
jgi:hypothetical protein